MLTVWLTILPSIFLSGLFLPVGGHAESPAVGLLYRAFALLPGDHSGPIDQGSGGGSDLARDPGAGAVRHCDHGGGFGKVPEEAGLIKDPTRLT